MSTEVARILMTIEKNASFQGAGAFIAQTRLEKILQAIALVALGLTLVLLFIEPLRLAGLLAGLVFLLTVVALILAQVFSITAVVRRPLAGYAEAANAKLEARGEYVSALAAFSPEALLQAKAALERDSSSIRARLAVLVGSIEKIGFIPAGAALYYAALQAPSDGLLPSNILVAFVFGLYGGALLGQRVVEALHKNIACIEEAYEAAQRQEKAAQQ